MVKENKKKPLEKLNKLQEEREKNNFFSLLDGATSQIPTITPELDSLRKIVIDKTRTLEERLESFEIIIDSEIGDTNLTRGKNIEREIGLRQIYLKFEGGNPTGTQKDRIAFAQALDALRRGYEEIAVASCGNYGASIALAASLAGLDGLIYIPSNYHTNRIKEMTKYGAKIVRVPGDYEEAVKICQLEAEKNDYYDANPGGSNINLQLKAYGEIAYEIYDELRDAPLAVAVPVSNGSTLAGIYRGFVSLYNRGKTSRIPQFIAGSSYGMNPIVQAFVKNTPKCVDLLPERIRNTSINEPLVNWRSIDGEYALSIIRDTRGWAAFATDKKMREYSKLLREMEGLSVLPASTAGLIALMDRHKKQPFPGDRFVVILTGRKA
ncbi:MAG: threonine synthase [miscellaneous Crenarchaeota group-6 archaeon AD8-1]|nr:MAG: threonine synthase [miscellaneous Crenarchaeota group-6 archaeon AD8-1]